MAAGRKTVRVLVQAPTEVSDGQGGVTTTWTTVGPAVWAEVETNATREEMWTAGQTMARVRRVLTVWYSSALAAAQPTWRVIWGSRVLQVQAVENVEERNRELRLHCLEIQGSPA